VQISNDQPDKGRWRGDKPSILATPKIILYVLRNMYGSGGGRVCICSVLGGVRSYFGTEYVVYGPCGVAAWQRTAIGSAVLLLACRSSTWEPVLWACMLTGHVCIRQHSRFSLLLYYRSFFHQKKWWSVEVMQQLWNFTWSAIKLMVGIITRMLIVWINKKWLWWASSR